MTHTNHGTDRIKDDPKSQTKATLEICQNCINKKLLSAVWNNPHLLSSFSMEEIRFLVCSMSDFKMSGIINCGYNTANSLTHHRINNSLPIRAIICHFKVPHQPFEHTQTKP